MRRQTMVRTPASPRDDRHPTRFVGPAPARAARASRISFIGEPVQGLRRMHRSTIARMNYRKKKENRYNQMRKNCWLMGSEFLPL